MIDVTIKKHLGVLIGSINKLYNKAKINGTLNAKDIYYLNTLYRLLNNIELTSDESNQILKLYNSFSFCSDDICPPIVYKSYKTTNKVKFQQAEVTDCNTYPKKKEILYWQEDYTLNNSQITNLVDDTNYLVDKPSDTYENFEIGKNIDYTKIGKIVFLALESDTINYIIKDDLNIDVTHTFNISLIPQLNATLFISDNNYSHGIMNFKIIKQ